MINAETKTIFLAEDEELVAKAYKFFLIRAGFKVLCVKDGNEVLPKVVSSSPDLILMDLVMPGMNGFDVLKNLKKNSKTKAIPVFIISNLSQQSEIDRCLKLGAVDYVIKSNSTAKGLIERINKFFSH